MKFLIELLGYVFEGMPVGFLGRKWPATRRKWVQHLWERNYNLYHCRIGNWNTLEEVIADLRERA